MNNSSCYRSIFTFVSLIFGFLFFFFYMSSMPPDSYEYTTVLQCPLYQSFSTISSILTRPWANISKRVVLVELLSLVFNQRAPMSSRPRVQVWPPRRNVLALWLNRMILNWSSFIRARFLASSQQVCLVRVNAAMFSRYFQLTISNIYLLFEQDIYIYRVS